MKFILFTVFIAVALTVFGMLTYYLLYHLKKLTLFKGQIASAIYGVILFMTLSTVLGRVILSYSHVSFAFTIMIVGYCWLAFLFIFLVWHGIPKLVIKAVNQISKQSYNTASMQHFLASFTIAFVIVTYGMFEATSTRVKSVTLESSKISKELGQIKVMQISDVHFGPTTRKDMAERIVKIAHQEKPDLILSTGDILDKHVRERAEVVTIMNNLKAKFGKYAITGNHEFISGIKRSEKFIKDLGFQLLRNNAITIPGIINLVGPDDLSAKRFGNFTQVPEETLFKTIDPTLYTILMKHQPRINDKSLPLFDLQLSGHTHAGQIFPFMGLVKIVFPYLFGLYDLEGDAKLYVNQGTGSWGPPVRFLVPPEVTIINIKHK